MMESPIEDLAILALKGAIQLLDGGNRTVQVHPPHMQEKLFNVFTAITVVQDYIITYLTARKDEQLFAIMKDKLQTQAAVIEDRKKYLATDLEMRIQFKDGETTQDEHQVKPHHEIKTTTMLLRFLQLLCEGHHLELQNYLNLQHDNISSFNIVKEVVLFVKQIIPLLDKHCLDLAIQAFETLTEFCQVRLNCTIDDEEKSDNI